MNLDIYKTISQDKHFSYKVKMAIILLSKEEAYEVLYEYNKKSMLREGEPSAIWEHAIKELYETKAWYIPDRLKLWDRRFGELFQRPFFTFDEDEKTWTKILEFYIRVSTPKKEDYPNTRVYNKDWGFFAELLAVAEKNAHPLFAHSYQILQEKGLPQKVFQNKRDELQKYNLLEKKNNRGIEHFSDTKVW